MSNNRQTYTRRLYVAYNGYARAVKLAMLSKYQELQLPLNGEAVGKGDVTNN